jgi:subtilisin-like proprotein convertase family protein
MRGAVLRATTLALVCMVALVGAKIAQAAAPAATYSSGNIAGAINDSATNDFTISVPDAGRVVDANVSIRLNHTYDGDLRISLIAPDGSVVRLSDRNGSSDDNYGSGSTDCSGTFTRFDDSAIKPIGAGDAPFAGLFKPDAPLTGVFRSGVSGTWTLRIEDLAGGDTGTLYCWTLRLARDDTAPTVPVLGGAMNRHFQTSARFLPTWHATDPQTSVDLYRAYMYSFAWNSASLNSLGRFATTHGESAAFTGSAGNSYCPYVVAYDIVRNATGSAFPGKCTAVPVNNTSLLHQGTWAKKTAIGYYMNTYSQTTHAGASLKLVGVVADQLALIVTKCPGCGTVDVFLDTTFLKRVSLNATTTRHKQVVALAPFGSQSTGDVTITVHSSGKPVKIEGLGVLNIYP